MANINLTPKSLDAVNQLIDDDNVEAYISLCDDLIDKIMETGTEITLTDDMNLDNIESEELKNVTEEENNEDNKTRKAIPGD